MKQPLLTFTTQMTAQPGGAFLVKPGKPIQWAKCSEAARHLGISPRTLRDWFNLPALELLKAKWTLDSVLG